MGPRLAYRAHVLTCVVFPVDGRHSAYLPPKGRLYCALQPQGPLLPRGFGSQRLLLNPADLNGTILAGTIDLTLPTPGGLSPHSHGTPEDDLGRDCRQCAPRPCTLAIHAHVSYSDRPSRRPPPASVVDSLSHPDGGHYLLDLVKQCALHKAQQHALVLPGGDYLRDTTTLCGRGWRGDLSHLLVPHFIHSLSQGVR